MDKTENPLQNPVINILVVDDSPTDRAIFRRFLSQNNAQQYVFSEAESIDEGFRKIRSELPDCVLLDYDLPDGNGNELIEKITGNFGKNSIPVVMISGSGNIEIAVEAMRSGAQDFLIKNNATAADLVRAVQNAIDKVYLYQESRLTHQKIQISEERYRLLFENTPLPAIVFDRNSLGVLAINDYAVIHYGYTRNEFLSLTLNELDAFDGASSEIVVGEFCSQSSMVRSIPARHRKKDGSVMDVEVNCHDINFQERDARFVIVNDITDRKEAELKLRESEEFNRTVIESSPDCVKILDRQGKLQFMNENGMCLMEIENFDDFKGQYWWKLWENDNQQIIRQMVAKAVNGEVQHLQALSPTAKGTQKWWDVLVAPVRNRSGEIERILSVSRDITESKRTELKAAFLAEISGQLADANSIEEILQNVGSKIGTFLDLSVCAFVEIDKKSETANVTYDWHRENAPSLVGNHRIGNFLTDEVYRASLAGETLAVNDIKADSGTDSARYLDLEIHSFVTVPVMENGKFQFLMSMNDSKPRDWRPDEIELIREITNRIWISLQRHRAQIALRESEENFRAVFDSIDEGFCIIEMIFDANRKPTDYRILQANPAFSRLTGLPENSVGKTVRELVPDLEEFWFETYGEVALTRESRRFENRSIPLNRWFDVYASPFGEPQSQRVALVFNNITSRKQAETELQESQRFSQSIIEAAPTMTYIFDIVKSCNVFVSRQSIAMLGYTSEEILQMSAPNLIDLLHPEDLSAAGERFRNILKSDDNEIFELEHRMRRKDGEWVWLNSRDCVFRRGENGAPTQVLGVSTDITARKQAEQEREEIFQREQELRSQAESANRAKDQFLAVLSHELRTPLNAMSGWARMLSQGILDEPKQRKAIEVIERNIRLQNTLIEDLLDVSRIISGKIKLEPTEVNLCQLITDAIETARFAAEEKHIAIEHFFSADTCLGMGDIFRLQQIIGNLLTNAIKFTPENGKIFVSLEAFETTAKITISDTGIGIEPELLPHIFERFKQADGSTKRKFGGLGLGLAIVKSLVEMHGGEIIVKSEGADRGSAFIVELPTFIKDNHTDNGDGEICVNNSLNHRRMLENIRIVLVDDEPDSLELLRFVLTNQGAETVAFSSPTQALKNLEDIDPDLLISDISMSEMDGYELIRRVRGMPFSKAKFLPAIAMTAYTSVEDRAAVLSAGFQMHIAKPINVSEVAGEILEMLDNIQH